MTDNYSYFDRDELLNKGISNEMVETLAALVERNPDDYVVLSYAGNPNGNISSNFSHLCVDTTNDFMYYSFTVGSDTWTKIVV